MTYLILLGILALLALVFGILSVKTWRWPDIVAGFLVFLAAMGFVILLSASMHERGRQLRELASQQARFKKNHEENERLLHGDRTEAGSVDSYTTLSTKLSRFLLDRGRVWRECAPTA